MHHSKDNLTDRLPQICIDDQWINLTQLPTGTLAVRSNISHQFEIQFFQTSTSIDVIILGDISSLENNAFLEVSCSMNITHITYTEVIQHTVRTQLQHADPLKDNHVGANVTIRELHSDTNYKCCVLITMHCSECSFSKVTSQCEPVVTDIGQLQADNTNSVVVITLGSIAGILLLIILSTWCLYCIKRMVFQQRYVALHRQAMFTSNQNFLSHIHVVTMHSKKYMISSL